MSEDNENIPRSAKRGGAIRDVPIPQRGAELPKPRSVSEAVQEGFLAAFTRQVEIRSSISFIAESTIPKNHKPGKALLVPKGTYIYRRDPEDPKKLIAVGINDRFVNATTTNDVDNPFEEDRLDVTIPVHDMGGDTVIGRVPFTVIPDGKGSLKGTPKQPKH